MFSLRNLNQLSKSELIDKIVELQKKVALTNVQNNNNNNNDIEKKSSKTKPKRELDFKKFKRRHIFLRFLYLGWNYNGYVVQENTEQTVEAAIYEALLQTRLIESKETANMNRCGRTDKGVSAFSQVISVTVRSNLKAGDDLIVPDDYTGTDVGLCDIGDEVDYIQALNGVLPKDIRMYAWAPLPIEPQASARFDCRRRVYQYHCGPGFDFAKMNSAAQYLVGEHDFRNLCKMDVRNGVTNYVRTVYNVQIDSNGVFKIEASAFLYHQIRCIMTILMMVGSGLEEPTIVQELLDIKANPAKPQYPLADDLRLVLFDVFYDESLVPKWNYGKSDGALQRVITILSEQHAEHSTKASILRSMIDELRTKSSTLTRTTTEMAESVKHKPLMKRPRCLTLEEALEKVSNGPAKRSKESSQEQQQQRPQQQNQSPTGAIGCGVGDDGNNVC